MSFRSSLLRLARPASNVISRRASPVPLVSQSSNVSGLVRLPSSRSLNTSSILKQQSLNSTVDLDSQPPSIPNTEAVKPEENDYENSEYESSRIDNQSASETISEYEALKQTSEPISIESYHQFMASLADAKAFKQTYRIYKDMKTAGVQPTAETYGYLMKAGRRSLRIFEIREFFGQPYNNRGENQYEAHVSEQDRKKNSAFYNEMKGLVEEMKSNGIELETWFWDDTAAWLASINHAGLLVNIAIALESRGISPSQSYYCKMLYCLPRCGFSERADLLFSRMVLNNMADLNVYTLRLGSLVYMGRYSEAEALFNEILEKFEASEVAYNSMIHGYLEASQFEKAIEVFEKMKASTTVQPNSITACTFLSYFYESGKLENANSILDYFKESLGFPSTPTEQANLLKFYARYDPAQASRLVEDLIAAEPNFEVTIYNAILNVLLDRRVQVDWKRTIGEIPLNKVYPMKANGLAEQCSSLPYHVRHLVARMEAFNVEANSTTVDLLMRGLLIRRDYAACMKLYEMLDKTNSAMFSSHRNTYLAALISSGASEAEIQRYLQLMKMRRWPISSVNNRRLAEIGLKAPMGAFVYTNSKPNSM